MRPETISDPDPAARLSGHELELGAAVATIATGTRPAEETTAAGSTSPVARSLEADAIRGSMWTLASYGSMQVLRLGANLILGRLLFPEAFGMMALVTVFIQGMNLLSDFGIGPSIIQHRRGDEPAFLNTAWAIAIMRGFAMWICVSLVAPPLAWALARNDPAAAQLAYLLPVAGLSLVFNGFNSTRLFTLYRHLAMGPLAVVELLSASAGVAATIAWAAIHPTVWALIGGGLLAALVKLVVSHVAVPGTPNRLLWDREAFRAMFHFGKWVFVSSLVTFAARNVDRVLLGGLVALDVLGVYSIALLVATVPPAIISQLTEAVLFPALAKRASGGTRLYAETVRRARGMLLPLGVAATLAVLLLAPPFFEYIYDPRYQQAAWMAQFTSLSVWFIILQATADRAPLALGNSRALALSNLVNALVRISGGLAGFRLYGLPGFILGLSMGPIAGHVVIQVAMHRAGMSIVRQDLKFTTNLAVLGAAGMLLPKMVAVAPVAHVGSVVAVAIPLLIVGCAVVIACYPFLILRGRGRPMSNM